MTQGPLSQMRSLWLLVQLILASSPAVYSWLGLCETCGWSHVPKATGWFPYTIMLLS